MPDQNPAQAGGSEEAAAAEAGSGRKGGGDSGGGAYPNPHSGKPAKDGILGHGGQTEIDQKLKPGEPEN